VQLASDGLHQEGDITLNKTSLYLQNDTVYSWTHEK